MFLHTAKNCPLLSVPFSSSKRNLFFCLPKVVSQCVPEIVSPLFSFRISPHLSFYSVASLFTPITDLFYLQIFQGFQDSAFSSSDTIPFLLPLTNILFNIPTLNFLHFPLRSLSISFLNLDLAPTSILKLLF